MAVKPGLVLESPQADGTDVRVTLPVCVPDVAVYPVPELGVVPNVALMSATVVAPKVVLNVYTCGLKLPPLEYVTVRVKVTVVPQAMEEAKPNLNGAEVFE